MTQETETDKFVKIVKEILAREFKTVYDSYDFGRGRLTFTVQNNGKSYEAHFNDDQIEDYIDDKQYREVINKRIEQFIQIIKSA